MSETIVKEKSLIADNFNEQIYLMNNQSYSGLSDGLDLDYLSSIAPKFDKTVDEMVSYIRSEFLGTDSAEGLMAFAKSLETSVSGVESLPASRLISPAQVIDDLNVPGQEIYQHYMFANDYFAGSPYSYIFNNITLRNLFSKAFDDFLEVQLSMYSDDFPLDHHSSLLFYTHLDQVPEAKLEAVYANVKNDLKKFVAKASQIYEPEFIDELINDYQSKLEGEDSLNVKKSLESKIKSLNTIKESVTNGSLKPVEISSLVLSSARPVLGFYNCDLIHLGLRSLTDLPYEFLKQYSVNGKKIFGFDGKPLCKRVRGPDGKQLFEQSVDEKGNLLFDKGEPVYEPVFEIICERMSLPDKHVKVPKAGPGGVGKDAHDQVVKFLWNNLEAWLDSGAETKDASMKELYVQKEMFYDKWRDTNSLSAFANDGEHYVTEGEALSLDKLCRLTAFNLSNGLFLPKPEALTRRREMWLAYANDKISKCGDWSDFEKYFNINESFVKSNYDPYFIAEALSLDVDSVKSRLDNLLLEDVESLSDFSNWFKLKNHYLKNEFSPKEFLTPERIERLTPLKGTTKLIYEEKKKSEFKVNDVSCELVDCVNQYNSFVEEHNALVEKIDSLSELKGINQPLINEASVSLESLNKKMERFESRINVLKNDLEKAQEIHAFNVEQYNELFDDYSIKNDEFDHDLNEELQRDSFSDAFLDKYVFSSALKKINKQKTFLISDQEVLDAIGVEGVADYLKIDLEKVRSVFEKIGVV